MKFEIDFERTYPFPPDKLWRALTEKDALGQWLMETDFKPEVGRAFKMWCRDETGGTDTYLCVLLEYDPPKRMVWSWILEGRQDLGETLVEFRVEPVDGGTRVTIVHSGDRDAATIEKFRDGWPTKLRQLESTLSGPISTS